MLGLKEDAVESLSRTNQSLEQEVQALQTRNGFLNETNTSLELLVWQVRFELDQSKKQATYLKRVITKKVDALKVAVELQKASDAANVTVKAELAGVKSSLKDFQAQRLAELCIEKHAVASLKTELATAYVSRIPLPETLDELATSVEQLVSCTSKQGCHLGTKVKVI
jgi:chromosome segregation ATPase